MGKRKHYEDEDYIEKEIRRLKRKRSRIRRHERRYRSYSSSNSDRYRSYSDGEESDYYKTDYDDEMLSQEASKGAPADEDYAFAKLCDVSARSGQDQSGPPAPSPPPLSTAPQPSIASVVVPVSSGATPTDVPAPQLDPSILSILGDEPTAEEKFGPDIQRDVASRWMDILVNGLQDESKKDIMKSYDPPGNFKIVQAPLINPEVKSAVNENAFKRDSILFEKQKLLTTAITSVASTISAILSADTETNNNNNILRSLSDTGRLLCHIHFSETQVRRNFLMSSLSKEVKESIKDLKRDQFLFGNCLQENIKAMKAITRMGAELRPTAEKQKLPPKTRQPEPSTSRALNWRGPPPPPPPPAPPRRNQLARTSSTAGGRRQPPRARRPSDRRAPRQHPRTSRR